MARRWWCHCRTVGRLIRAGGRGKGGKVRHSPAGRNCPIGGRRCGRRPITPRSGVTRRPNGYMNCAPRADPEQLRGFRLGKVGGRPGERLLHGALAAGVRNSRTAQALASLNKTVLGNDRLHILSMIWKEDPPTRSWTQWANFMDRVYVCDTKPRGASVPDRVDLRRAWVVCAESSAFRCASSRSSARFANPAFRDAGSRAPPHPEAGARRGLCQRSSAGVPLSGNQVGPQPLQAADDVAEFPIQLLGLVGWNVVLAADLVHHRAHGFDLA